MMQRLALIVFGWVRIAVRGSSIERFLNVCIRNELGLIQISREDETCIHATMHLMDFRKLQAHMGRTGCRVQILQRKGLPFFIYQLRKRYALWAGLFAAGVLYFALTGCVWVIELEVGDGISTAALRQELRNAGAYAGVPIYQVDETAIAHQVRNRMADTIDYISVSRIGNRIIVQAYGGKNPPEMLDEKAVTGIVASQDGWITQMNVKSGHPLVDVGDAVVRGQQLVSALTPPTTEQGLGHIGYSSAEIIAQTKHTQTSVCPLELQQKQYTGVKKTQFAIILGNFRINLYLGSGISGIGWEKSVTIDQLHIGEGTYFPIQIVRQDYVQYTVQTVTQSIEELEQQMLEHAKQRILSQMNQGEILHISSQVEQSDNVLFLTVQAICQEDIAAQFSEEGITLPEPSTQEKTE